MNRMHRTTVALPEDLLAAIDQLIRTGSAANRNQFLTLAVETELRRRERTAIDAEFALMAADPDYQAEAPESCAISTPLIAKLGKTSCWGTIEAWRGLRRPPRPG